MQRVLFKGIISKYQTNVNSIKNNADLNNIYSKFSFTFFPLVNMNDENQFDFDKYIINYIKQFKFFTYYISQSNQNSENSSPLKIDIVICVENECLIIEDMETDHFLNLLTELKNQKIASLNVSSNVSYGPIDDAVNEEVRSFCSNFLFKIKNNEFIKLTIRSISSFLIRRFFYPTEFFKDPTFFNYRERNLLKKENIKMKINKLLFFNKDNYELKKDDMKKEFRSIKTEIIQNIINYNTKIETKDFKMTDFIILRTLHISENAIFHLVFHINDIHVFVMKEFHFNQENKNTIYREIEFCEKYHHQCLMHFYGFVKKDQNIIGLIYEHLSNGTLADYITSNKNNKVYSITAILRIFQGIEFLHSNSFIYRDLKPQNILVDHDNIPYIADFESIRHPVNEEHIYEEITGDFGSDLYLSPEQMKGNFISFPTDIFSFGLLIYFIFEKKDMFSKREKMLYFNNENNIKIPSISNVSNNIKKIVEICINLNPSERPKIQEIKIPLFKEFVLQYYIEPYISNNNIININQSDINCFIYENIIIRLNHPRSMKNLFEEIHQYKSYFFRNHVEKERMVCVFDMGFLGFDDEEEEEEVQFIKETNDSLTQLEYFELLASLNDSYAQLKLGNLYFKGQNVQQDYVKAKNYYIQSAQQNNITAIFKLGLLYLNGYGVEKDYNKAKYYFILSARANYSSSFFALGYLYYNGFGVDKNYTLARNFFEKSASNNSNAQYHLGLIYYYGYGVKKDYIIAKEYLELAAESYNADALYLLGVFYYFGLGVKQDYNKAKEYFELAAENNCPEALNNLGNLYCSRNGVEKNISKGLNYYNLAVKNGDTCAMINLGVFYRDGFDTKPDISRALYYFKLAANNNNSLALYMIGDLYFRGLGVEKNYSKAINYFELSAKLNNQQALLILGDIYYEGYGVKKDFLKAKHYYEFSSYFNNCFAMFKLGFIYLNGVKNIEKNLLKAKKYFEQSAQLNYPNSLYYLGILYSYGDFRDINKAIECFSNCIKKHNNYIYIEEQGFYSSFYISTEFVYYSYNNLGLIYVTIFNELENAYKNLKEAAFNEFPFGQNNLGLFFQFYSNNIEDAMYMFDKSMKNKFSLAAYNIAYIKECEGKIVESIDYYKKASKLENEPLISHNNKYFDEQLEISKKFIICLANLKIAEYYFKQKSYDESKEYFIKAFNISENLQYKFTMVFNINELKSSLSYLKIFIFDFPLFNLKNQQNINLDSKDNNDDNIKLQPNSNLDSKDNNDDNIKLQPNFNLNSKDNNDDNLKLQPNFNLNSKDNNDDNLKLKSKIIFDLKINNENNLKSQTNINLDIKEILQNNNLQSKFDKFNTIGSILTDHNENIDINSNEKIIFNDPGNLFDFILKSESFKIFFIEQIEDIIASMKKILYIHPYTILFGRINIDKPKQDNGLRKNVTNEFYDGFGIK